MIIIRAASAATSEETQAMSKRQERPAVRQLFSLKLTHLVFIGALLFVAALLVLPTTFLAPRADAAAERFDIIIRGGRVVDGTGRAGFAADVGIRGDRVARVGRIMRNASARRTIDARGLIVAPGFIDMLGQSEQNLLIDPR